MTTQFASVSRAHSIYRNRGTDRTVGQVAYAVYIAILTALLVAAPVVTTLVSTAVRPESLQVLRNPASSQIVSACGVILLILLFFAGMVRGPALRPPFQTFALAGSSIDRSISMLQPFLRASLVLTGTLSAIAGFFASVFLISGTSTPARVFCFVVAVSLWGIIGSCVWLAGQSATGQWRWFVPAFLTVGGVASWTVPSANSVLPWGWLGSTWPPSGESGTLEPILLGFLAAALSALTPALLRLLRTGSLMEQSERWQSAGISTAAGEFSTALAVFRAKPRHGRRWTAVMDLPELPRFLIRDGVGALRTPGRFLIGSMGVFVGVILVLFAVGSRSEVAWLPAAAGSVAVFFSLGVFSDGFRHAAESIAATPIYGYSPFRMYALHSAFPVTWSMVCAGAACAAVTVIGGSEFNFAGLASLEVVLLTLIGIRIYDSARGPLPPVLLTPIPTPFGDLSSLVILTWQLDAILLSAGSAGLLAGALSTGTVIQSVLTAAISLGLLGWLTKRRLERL